MSWPSSMTDKAAGALPGRWDALDGPGASR